MWKFIKRQFSSKTGKAALGIIVGAIVGNIPVVGDLIGPRVTDWITAVATPETATISALAMLLRDRDLKKDGGPAPE